MKNKRTLIIAGVLLVLIGIIVVVVFATRGDNQEPPVDDTPERRRISEPVNQIPVEQRAYVSILPKVDGRHLSISINHLNKDAESVEYELEYQSGSMLQGAMGQIELTSLPALEEIFLGSCSAGGACTYHKDISGGNLLLKFIGDENYALKTNWRYIDNSNRSDEVASWDAKFQLQADVLATVRYSVVFNSPGPAAALDQIADGGIKFVSDFYALETSSNVSGKGMLSIRLTEDVSDARIVGFDGNDWVEYETSVESKVATARVELMKLYTVIE